MRVRPILPPAPVERPFLQLQLTAAARSKHPLLSGTAIRATIATYVVKKK